MGFPGLGEKKTQQAEEEAMWAKPAVRESGCRGQPEPAWKGLEWWVRETGLPLPEKKDCEQGQRWETRRNAVTGCGQAMAEPPKACGPVLGTEW